MAHFRVMQARQGSEPKQVGPTTRRFNGALSVLDEHVQLTVEHLRSKAQPGERVVTAPFRRNSSTDVAVVLVGDTEWQVRLWIERV